MTFMNRTSVIAFCLALFSLIAAPAVAQHIGGAQYPIKASDGDIIANFKLDTEMAAKLAALQAQYPVGNLQGDVTLMQFYDLNCPYCRAAAADVDAIVRADNKLKLILVPYAVLSVASVQGALVEVAAGKMLTPAKFLDFHRRLYANRGTIDGAKALEAAKDMGLDPAKVVALGNTQESLDMLRRNATVGGDAKLAATPAYVIGGVAIVGHPGRKALDTVIAAMRSCGKVVCGRT
jgi:protein-disulfide isomerase